MKVQVTQKAIRESAAHLISLPYCAMQEVERLCHITPYAYNAGVYGWNCDYYSFDQMDGVPYGVVISCGYRPHGTSYPTERLNEYIKIMRDACKTVDECRKVLVAMLYDMTGDNGLTVHHSAIARGYVSRKGTGYREAYRGRFGIGVKVHHPSRGMTSHHRITYLVV